jgi:hypothetical protein
MPADAAPSDQQIFRFLNDELHKLKERKAARTGHPIEESVFTPEQDGLRWS